MTAGWDDSRSEEEATMAAAELGGLEEAGAKPPPQKTKKSFQEYAKQEITTFFGIISFMRVVTRVNGPRFTVLLTLQYFGIKGLMYKYLRYMRYPYFNGALGLDPGPTARIWNIGFAPMSMKGVLGMVSDSFPLFGYYKNPYIIIASVVSVVGMIMFLVTPYDVARSATVIPAIALVFATIHVATGDLMCQGKFSELMRLDKDNVGETVVYTYTCMQISLIIVTATNAVMIEGLGPMIIPSICIPIIILSTVPSYLGWLPEKRVPKEKRNRMDMAKIKEFKEYFIMGVISASSSLMLVITTLVFPDELYVRLGINLVITAVVLTSSIILLPPTVGKCVAFVLLKDILYPDITAMTESWYMAEPTCVAGGPAFSLVYFQTYTALLGIAMGIVGYMIFQRMSRVVTYRSVYIITITLCALGGFVDLIMVSRWNIAIGISDNAMFILGDAILFDLITSLGQLPGAVMISHLCPPGMESTAFAILASSNNFGNNIGMFIGEISAGIGGVSSQVPCNYDALPLIIIVTHIIMPLCLVPLAPLLIPSIPLGDTLVGYDEKQREAAVAKKALRKSRWTRQDISSSSQELSI